MKKLLTSLLLALLILSMTFAFISCDKTPDDPPAESESDSLPQDSESSSGSESETEEDAVVDLSVHKIIENGVVKYSVIRPEGASKDLLASINDLVAFLSEKSSETVVSETDQSLDYITTGVHDEKKYEIVIGNTNYEKSAELMKTINYGEFIIKAEGRKIYIASASDTGLDTAIDRLRSLLGNVYDETKGEAALETSAIDANVSYDKTLSAIPVFDGGQISLQVDGGDKSNMVVLEKTTVEKYEAYVTKLKELGYKEHSSSTLLVNKFTMLTKGDVALNVLFTKADSTTRIISDDLTNTDLPNIDAEWDSSKKICDSKLIQIGTSSTNGSVHNGECYIIRLEDGRFIIVDGGFEADGDGDLPRKNGKRLYETLVEFTPEGMKPTVACWIITHAHSDHFGAFYYVAKHYSANLAVEQFVFNYPAKSETNGVLSARNEILKLISAYFPTADIVKSHIGQTFRYANFEMEILYTVELLWPVQYDGQNTVSLVTKFYINGQTILMPGDMSTTANALCIKHYGKYLQSDFYQVTHHGYAGGSNNFNQYVRPRWVLWPIGASRYDQLKADARNSWLSNPKSTVEIIFPGLFLTTVIDLPFNGTNYVVYDNK